MIKKKFANLIDLKSIITILMVVALVIGFFQNKINANELIPLVTMILTFYFTKKESEEKKDEWKSKNEKNKYRTRK